MPIYEYHCQRCRKEFELMRPISQSGEPGPCPTCGSPGERLVSSFASKVDFYIKPSGKGAFRQAPGSTATGGRAAGRRAAKS